MKNIKMTYKTNPTGVVYVKYFWTINVNVSFFTTWAIIPGIDNKLDAKITGITPAEFIFIGIKLCAAP